MAISPNTDFSTGQVLTATNANQWPRGIMAIGTNTVSGTATTTETVTITATTFTAVANRYYKMTYYEPIVCKPPVDQASTTLRIRLTNATGAEQQYGQSQSAGTANSAISLNVCIVKTLAAGVTTIVACCVTSTGTASLFRSATAPAVLVIEDMGPA